MFLIKIYQNLIVRRSLVTLEFVDDTAGVA